MKHLTAAWAKIAYQGGHQPPRDGAPLHALDDPESGAFPADVYDHPEWYWHGGEAYDRESARVIKAVRGKPDAQVTIYRAAPEGVTHFDSGNWVALAEAYCRQHAQHPTDPGQDMPVYSASVAAKSVRSGGNDIVEYGYWGGRVQAHLVSLRRQAAGPVILYPSLYGGKYHAATIPGTARCRGTIELDLTASPIHVQPDDERVHPICCSRCVAQGRR